MTEKILIATTDALAGFETKKVLGLVWANSTQSKHVGHDLMAIVKSMTGGEVKSYTKMTNEAREKVLHTLADQARKAGANAVVGVRFGSTQLLPATIDIYAYGTAVVVEKKK